LPKHGKEKVKKDLDTSAKRTILKLFQFPLSVGSSKKRKSIIMGRRSATEESLRMLRETKNSENQGIYSSRKRRFDRNRYHCKIV